MTGFFYLKTFSEILTNYLKMLCTFVFYKEKKKMFKNCKNCVNQGCPVSIILVDYAIEHKDENLDDLEESEKLAIKQWKSEHPELTVKHQRKMLEENLITELPWEQYLKAKADFSEEDEAAEEATKWAQEQLDLKKKEVTWMERVGNQQIKKTKE
jgi:hypothetical protein